MGHTQEQLNNMSVVEKATLLNQLRTVIWTGTDQEGEATINLLFDSYSKETNILIDSVMWQVYGLHYKEYIEVIGPLLTWDVLKLEQAIDKKILWCETKIEQDKKDTANVQ